jgi:hypothetical protein
VQTHAGDGQKLKLHANEHSPSWFPLPVSVPAIQAIEGLALELVDVEVFVELDVVIFEEVEVAFDDVETWAELGVIDFEEVDIAFDDVELVNSVEKALTPTQRARSEDILRPV